MSSTITIFTARKIITMNPVRPEATAVAVRDNRILGVGTLEELEGWGEYVLDMAVEHAKKRVIFEEPIGSYQGVQHPLARAKTDLELAKLAVTRAVTACKNKENRDDISVYASIAKYTATEAAYAAFDVSMQAHGGYSADRETGIIALWPMVLLSRIIPLNNDVILEKYAEAALGLPEGAVS